MPSPHRLVFLCALFVSGCVFETRIGNLPEAPDVSSPTPSATCITMEPRTLTFDDVEVGDTKQLTALIANDCDASIDIFNIQLAGDTAFTIQSNSMAADERDDELEGISPNAMGSLEPGDSIVLNTIFKPSHRALARGGIQIDASIVLEPFSLLGNPSGPCLELGQAELDMGCQIIGTTTWRPIPLLNCGSVPVKIETLQWGSNSDDVFTVENVDLPIVMEAGESRDLSIGYSPIPGPPQIAPFWDAGLLEIGTLGYSQPHSVSVMGFGKTFSCEGLRAVLVWVTPGDPDPKDRGPEAGSDMDLHLLHPFGVDFFDIPFDTYWYNANPQWGQIDNPIDDPILSLDDYDSLGPEKIVLPLPEEGLDYTLGVHYWSDHGFGPSRAQVQVSIFGELVYESALVDMVSGEIWEVGTVTWPTGEVVPFTGPEGEPMVHSLDMNPCEVITCGK
jgi:hypothetical protein